MKTSEIVVVAAKYRVAAFQKSNGQPVWETVLVDTFFKGGGPFVTLALDEHAVYAHTTKLLFCLDAATGRILWQRDVAALGRDIISLAVLGGPATSTSSIFAKIQADRQSDANAAGGAV